MTKKLTGRALARFEAGRDIWQEVLDGINEIKDGGGKRACVEPSSPVVRARLKSGLTQAQFAALLGVSRRTLEQWEQGRRAPSGAAKTLIRLTELLGLACGRRLCQRRRNSVSFAPRCRRKHRPRPAAWQIRISTRCRFTMRLSQAWNRRRAFAAERPVEPESRSRKAVD